MSNTKKTLRSNNTIGYKGVSKTKKKFKATITVDRKINYLGSFDTPKEAALAYDRAVTHHKLPAKKLNFPNGLPIDDDDYDALMNPTKKRKLQSDTTTGYIGIGVDNDTTMNSTNPNKKRKSSSRNTTGYRGVTKKGRRFKAQLYFEGTQNNLGTYDTPKEAAVAYDRAVVQYKLPASKLNFPNDYDTTTSRSEDDDSHSDEASGAAGDKSDGEATHEPSPFPQPPPHWQRDPRDPMDQLVAAVEAQTNN